MDKELKNFLIMIGFGTLFFIALLGVCFNSGFGAGVTAAAATAAVFLAEYGKNIDSK